MSVTQDKIKFTDTTIGYEWEFTPPVFGYKTTIDMCIDYDIGAGEGDIYSFDNGVTYDRRYCDCKFLFDQTEANLFSQMIHYYNTFSYYGNNGHLKIELNSNSGFFPFGPDKGDTGPFWTIPVFDTQNQGALNKDFDLYEFGVRFVNSFAYPSVTFRTDTTTDGDYQYGSITNIRSPINGHQNIAKNSNENWIFTENSIDSYVKPPGYVDPYLFDATSEIDLTLSTPKAQRLINDIVTNVRTNEISLNTNSKYYLFGILNELNIAPCLNTIQIYQNKIEILHSKHDSFNVNLRLHGKDIQ